MRKLMPAISTLHRVAGEGDFNIYRQLKEGKRFFLFAKCLITSWSYYRGRGDQATEKTVAFVKGPNQLRYQKQVMQQLEDEFGGVEIFMTAPIKGAKSNKFLPRINLIDVAHQMIYLLCMLLTGKRRFLNLYLLSFSAAIDKVVCQGIKNIKNFICFNDQPFDVAAVVYALNKRNNIRTIVIQHGLIVSEKFYFPVVAQEFWGWGDLSKIHYCRWDLKGCINIKGRYKSDVKIKDDCFKILNNHESISILIAPSHAHHEVLDLIWAVNEINIKNSVKIKLGIKLHPSTKLLFYLALKIKRKKIKIQFEEDGMEELADKYDGLVTVNSTSSIDFLLRGKPVFFSKVYDSNRFPSQDYGCVLIDLSNFCSLEINSILKKNNSRLRFLMSAINV